MLRTKEGKVVPLKSVNVHVDLKERICGLTFEQTFLNEEKDAIEAVYVFPTPGESSVFSFEAKTDEGKVITALCKEKLQAKKEYNQAVKDGNTGFYMDHDDSKHFRICVGNLAPISGVTITIKIVCELDNEEDNSKIRLNIPVTIGNKYTPSYYSSSRSYNPSTTNPPKVNNRPYHMNITGDIQMGSRLVSVDSKTHKIKLSNMEKHSAHFEITDLEELNRDVVLTVERESSATTCFTQELPSSALKNPVLKFCTAVNLIPDFSKMPKVNINDCEYILCLDVSGSMEGKRIENCKDAAQKFVACIPNGATFKVFTFNTYFKEFTCDETDIIKRKEAASAWIDKIRADGGTELMPVLKEIYSKVDKKKNTVIIVLSDGDISNTADVFKLIKANASSGASVFSVGIGANVSQDLIKGLAIHGGGRCEFIGDGDKDIIKPVRSLMKLAQDTLRKHQNDYKVEISTIGGLSRNVPSVFAPLYENVDNTLYFFSEFEPASVTFTTYEGEDANNRTETPLTIVPVKVNSSEVTMHRIAGIKLMNELYAQEKLHLDKPKGSRVSDMNVETDDEVSPLKQEIISVSTDLNVLSSYTAFIGVEHREDKLTGNVELREVPLQEAKREYSYGGNESMLESCSFSSNSRGSLRAMCAMSMPQSRSMNKSVSNKCLTFDDEDEEEDGMDDFGFGNEGYSIKSANVRAERSVAVGDKGDTGPTGNSGPKGFMDKITEFFTQEKVTPGLGLNYSSPVGSSMKNSTHDLRSNPNKPTTTDKFKPKPTAVFTVDKELNGLLTKGLLSGRTNGSLLDLLVKLLYGVSVTLSVTLSVGSIIQLTGESSASHNGYYEIIELGNDDEPWVLQCVY